jgi:hypothetical protein
MRDAILVAFLIGSFWGSPGHGAALVDSYLERYFQTFPSAATAAGRHDLDRQLEDLGPQQRQAWLRFNRETVEQTRDQLADAALGFEDRLDLELLLREAERQVFSYGKEELPARDPLYWTGILGNATVFLLVRDDLPLAERLTSAAARAALIPRLADQARQALSRTAPSRIAAELCGMAEYQARSTAKFYREGFPRAAGDVDPKLRQEVEESGTAAATALSALADYLSLLQEEATGSVRLGDLYAEKFRRVTGIDERVEDVLADAEKALSLKVSETATYGRSQWAGIFPADKPPADDRQVIEALFKRVSEDRAKSTDEFVEDYRSLVDRSVEFVRSRRVMTLPEPLTLQLGRSPSFFIGQSVGGVYPAGPYAPQDSKTLLFLPTPADQATPEQRDAFFRDFNHHFNVMITPHELIPGHYLQLKFASQHPHKVRALFGDGVYIEGWGTFAERLMLDLGWGEPLDRIAHLKKQLENIARTIVDIRVHTQEMSREETLAFVQNQALQDEQFAANMWRRAITSAPQLTFYYLGYREVWGLYEDVRNAQGGDFDLQAFMDGMMELGPVPVRHYRERMLGVD